MFKTNGHPVASGDQKLGWTSLIWPWATKNYNRLYKEGNFLSISGRPRENFSLKHWNLQVKLPIEQVNFCTSFLVVMRNTKLWKVGKPTFVAMSCLDYLLDGLLGNELYQALDNALSMLRHYGSQCWLISNQTDESSSSVEFQLKYIYCASMYLHSRNLYFVFAIAYSFTRKGMQKP